MQLNFKSLPLQSLKSNYQGDRKPTGDILWKQDLKLLELTLKHLLSPFLSIAR